MRPGDLIFNLGLFNLRPMANGNMVTPSGKRVSVCATQHFTIVLARQIGVLVSWVEESGSISLR